MKRLLLLLCCGTTLAAAQTSVPTLVASGIDSLTPMNMEISKNGYTIGFTYYQYCTNVICFNDGMRVTVYDSNGHLNTTLRFEKPDNNTSTSSKVYIQDAAVDGNNDLILGGTFHSDVNFDPNNSSTAQLLTGNTEMSNTADIFIAKYHLSDGKLVWVKVFKGSDNPLSGFTQMAIDKNNNIYALYPQLNGNYDINPGSPVVSVNQPVLVKYNSSGDYITHKILNPVSTQYYKCLRYTPKGLYLLAHEDSSGKKVFSMKQFDLNTFNTIRAKRFGWFDEDATSTGRRKVNDFVFAKDDIWMIGDHINTLTIPTASGTFSETLAAGQRGFFLVRLDTGWNVKDVKLLQKTTQQYYCPVKLGVDSTNNLMIVGSVMDSIDADLGSGTYWVKPNSGPYKASGYMLYYDNNLNLQWAKKFGDTSNTNIAIAQFGDKRQLYVAGTFKGTTNFCVTGSAMMQTSMLANANGYYARYQWNTAATTTGIKYYSNTVQAGIYPNPAHDVLYIQLPSNNNTTISYTVYDAKGSIVLQQSGLTQSLIPVATGNLAEGAYYLLLTDGKGLWETHRFIRQ